MDVVEGADTLHLIIRVTPTGLYATSPQAPGLAYGRRTLDELRADLPGALAFHFDRPGPSRVIEHHERHYDVGEGELVTRIALDAHQDERQSVYTRLGSALAIPEQARSLVSDFSTNAVGEVVYLCAVPSDTLGWIAAQLDPDGDSAVIAASIADEFVFTAGVHVGREGTHLLHGRTEHDADTTVGDILRAAPIVTPPSLDRSLAS